MSTYTKQNFIAGQILTAQALNHIENGIEANDAAVAALSEEMTVQEDSLYTAMRRYNAHYWQCPPNIRPQAGVEYIVKLTPAENFTLSQIQMGTAGESAAMVDTLAQTATLKAGETYEIKYIPSVDNLLYLRVYNSANKFSSIGVYVSAKADAWSPQIRDAYKSLPTNEEEIHYSAHRAICALDEARAIKNVVDNAVSSMLYLTNGESVEKQVTVDSVGAHEKAFVRVGLHYETNKYGTANNELYFDESCKKDFSDVRFFDSNGNMLKAEFGPLVNMELAVDPNVSCVRKIAPNGTLVGFDSERGLVISTDNAATWSAIPNTYNVTANASEESSRTSMYPVFVDEDNNIFAYAGGKMYKLYASDSYATIREVCDFSFEHEGRTIYPDIQNHAMDKDNNGVMYFGHYQVQFKARIYKSTDGGENWSVSYHNTGLQHIHHIHADPYSNKVYAGIDKAADFYGVSAFVTEDGGNTWTDLTRVINIRGKDYYPTYFGENYRLGGGESYLYGSGAAYRSEDDVHLECVVKGSAGVRSYADWGDDSLIICGTQAATRVAENQLLISEDKGKTWKSIYKKYQTPRVGSGYGFRDAIGAAQVSGDTESCVIFPLVNGFVDPMRVYKGGNHWYREAFIEVDNTQDADFTIIAKTGFSIPYPYTCLEGREHDGLVYHLPLNEGTGRIVKDSNGKLHRIIGSYKWDNSEEPVRYGDYPVLHKHPSMPSSGLYFNVDSRIEIGKIPELNFSDDFTVSIWFNHKGWLLDQDEYELNRKRPCPFLKFGEVEFHKNENRFIITPDGTWGRYSGEPTGDNSSFNYSDCWYHVVFAVKNGQVKVYLNGCNDGASRFDKGAFAIDGNLSEKNLTVGSYYGIHPHMAMSDLKIYNRAMEADEVLELYRGW